MSWYSNSYWKPYVSVAQRKAKALRAMQKLEKKGVKIQPVKIEGRTIAKTFWGKGWCDHLESFSDFSNRLPRGRTYARNGSVCHLEISTGKVEAYVSGSELYKLKLKIQPLPTKKWATLKQKCTGQIGSLLELLQGKLSESIMSVVTDRAHGLFPTPQEISLACNCPDYAHLCKHLAAVMYGIGARLDKQPELLFLLRGVDHEELITVDAEHAVSAAVNGRKGQRLAQNDLSGIFGIEIEDANPMPDSPARRSSVQGKTVRKKTVKRNTTTQKTAKKKTTNKAAKQKTAKKKSTIQAKAKPQASARNIKKTDSFDATNEKLAKKKIARKK
ncbi:MAG TPA: hypothetical protein VMM56_16500 [Planctomycetaceae bacterium]|nr:hypothetical protein [Planctomycetaceae bacterium]